VDIIRHWLTNGSSPSKLLRYGAVSELVVPVISTAHRLDWSRLISPHEARLAPDTAWPNKADDPDPVWTRRRSSPRRIQGTVMCIQLCSLIMCVLSTISSGTLWRHYLRLYLILLSLLQHIRSWLRRSFVSYHLTRSLSGTSFLTKPFAGHLLPSRSIDLFSYIIMYSRSIYVALGLIFATSSSAVPTQSPGSQLSGLHSLVGRALTTDNTCGNVLAGNGNNYTCNPALAQGGACCSASGYCGLFYSSPGQAACLQDDLLTCQTGTTTDYCGVGCQSTFGTCSGSEVIAIDPNVCGPAHSNNKCLSGLCCSGAGYAKISLLEKTRSSQA